MNVIDSSGWIEYILGGPNEAFFAGVVARTDEIIVPTIVVVEVLRFLLRKTTEETAAEITVGLRQGRVIDLTPSLARSAAKLGVDLKLPIADSIILATARAHDATLWTQDADFETIPGVQFVRKQ